MTRLSTLAVLAACVFGAFACILGIHNYYAHQEFESRPPAPQPATAIVSVGHAAVVGSLQFVDPDAEINRVLKAGACRAVAADEMLDEYDGAFQEIIKVKDDKVNGIILRRLGTLIALAKKRKACAKEFR
jgi:hypothetical protein